MEIRDWNKSGTVFEMTQTLGSCICKDLWVEITRCRSIDTGRTLGELRMDKETDRDGEM